MSDIAETVPSAIPAPAAPVPTSESRFLRILRRTLLISACCIPVCITLNYLCFATRVIWPINWISPILLLSLVVCLFSAVIRLGYALWATSQYAMGEMLVTFLSASLFSTALLQWLKSDARDFNRQFDTSAAVVVIVFLAFALFLAGSAWAWSIFRRAPGLVLNRYAGLACGWISGIGFLSAIAFLFYAPFSLLLEPDETNWNYFFGFLAGSFLSIPGILIERVARRAR